MLIVFLREFLNNAYFLFFTARKETKEAHLSHERFTYFGMYAKKVALRDSRDIYKDKEYWSIICLELLNKKESTNYKNF